MELPFAESWKIKMVEPIEKVPAKNASNGLKKHIITSFNSNQSKLHRSYHRLRNRSHERPPMGRHDAG